MGQLVVGYNREIKRGPIVSTGNHLAICYGVVDLGTTIDKYDNPRHMVKLTWELCNEFRTTQDDKEIPISISKKYTLSLAPKAYLRADLVGWRGKEFSKEEIKHFDLKNLLGKPCLLNVIHSDDTADDIYAYVSSISPVIKGLDISPQYHNSIFISFQDKPYNMEVYKKLPEFLQEQIKKSEEWQSINGNKGKPSEEDSESAEQEELSETDKENINENEEYEKGIKSVEKTLDNDKNKLTEISKKDFEKATDPAFGIFKTEMRKVYKKSGKEKFFAGLGALGYESVDELKDLKPAELDEILKDMKKETGEKEVSVEKLQDEIKTLIGMKYDQEHQSSAVKQWLGAASVQGCKNTGKLEKFLKRLNELENIKQKNEGIPF